MTLRGGVFDLLIHDVDMAIYLFGKPRGVTATGYENLEAGLDMITAQLHYDHIPSVTITGGWHHPKAYPFSMEYTVSAEGGTIDYSTDNRPPSLYNAAGEYALGSAYVNFMPDDESDRIEKVYGPNYKRLVEIKRRYDPSNLFRSNQNIKPGNT